jgi:hypothetical protein
VQRDGGQLALFNTPHTKHSSSKRTSSSGSCDEQPAGYLAGEPALLIAPLAGRLLVFDARLPHEVLPAQRHRYSITAFFYKTQQQGTLAAGPAHAEAAALAAHPAEVQKEGAGKAAEAEASKHSAILSGGCEDCHAETAAGAMQTGTASSAGRTSLLPRIFVSIAAFRDEECQWTLRDLFLQATHPERVFAGVVWQVDPQADQAFTRMAGGQRTASYQQQVRYVAGNAMGLCLAVRAVQLLQACVDRLLLYSCTVAVVMPAAQCCL